MFRKLGNAVRRFMYGRYGTDQLGSALVILGLVLSLLGAFVCGGLIWVSYAVLVYYVVRAFSRNFTRRRQENAWFLRQTAPLRDRQHRYFRCPCCRQSVRVPRGKGRIAIKCPKCGNRFEKKS